MLIARRIADDGPEIILPGFERQMPQGGIDAPEDPFEAARRELREETGVASTASLGEISDRLSCDVPPYAGPPHRLARFRGQRRRRYALRFTGDDAEIDLRAAAAPEFDAWRWERLDRLSDLVVPFKRAVYLRVAAEFRRLPTRSNRTRPLRPDRPGPRLRTPPFWSSLIALFPDRSPGACHDIGKATRRTPQA